MARHWRKTLGTVILAGSLLLGAPATQALPPGGANTSNTAGTESTVSPLTLRAGDTISFTLTGFPAHEQVYIKVDDGAACPSDSAQGACVVHQQKTDAQGQASGSFVLSKELAEGQHTLRFLATEIMKDDKGAQIGTQGYSNQSPVFSITGVNENSSGGSTRNVSPETINKSVETGTQNHNGKATAEEQVEEKADTGKATTATGDSETTVQEEITYLDANGQKISKEEYEVLMASGTPASSTSASPLPSSATAVASASAKAARTGKAEQTAVKEAQTETQPPTEIPWIGLAGLGIAAVVSLFIVLGRRRS